MKHVGAARKQIGRRTIFNLLGPLASPAKVTRQLVGVFSADWLVPYAAGAEGAGQHPRLHRPWRDGLDEVSISAATQMAVLENGTRDQPRTDAGGRRA